MWDSSLQDWTGVSKNLPPLKRHNPNISSEESECGSDDLIDFNETKHHIFAFYLNTHSLTP